MESVTSSCSRTCCNHTIARCLSVPTACATRSTCSCARRASSSAGSPYISRASIWARTAANSSVVVFMFFLFPFRPVAKARPRSGACPVRFHRSPATAGSCVPLPAGALATASQSFLSTLGAGRIANDGFPAPDVLARRDNNDGDLRRQCLQRGVSQSALCSIPHRRHRAEPTRPALGRDLDLYLVLSRFPSHPSFRRLRVVRRPPRALRVLVVFVPVVLFASLALGPVAHPLGAVRAERPRSIPSGGAAGLVSLAAAREQASPTRIWPSPVGDPPSEERRAAGVPTVAENSERVLEQKRGGSRDRWYAQNWIPASNAMPSPVSAAGWSLRSTPPICWGSKRPLGT